jgi:hypothetical protein
MSSPIEEFLRQAAERRVNKPPPVVVPPVQGEPEVLVAERAEPDRSLADTHLEHHIDTSDLADHAEHLGEEVSRANDQVDQHVHDVFDHQVGELDGAYASPAATIPAEGDGLHHELKRALRSPQQVRRAVVFSEILRRPEWRW